MRGTSRFTAKIILGLLVGAGVAACTLAGGDIDHYNSGNGDDTTSSGGSKKGDASDGAAPDGGGG